MKRALRAMTAEPEWSMYEHPHGHAGTRGFWRGIAGAVAAGLTLLALALYGALMFAPELGVRGPDAEVLAGHTVAAVFAVAGSILADRTRGLSAFIGMVGVFAIASITLWWFWLS